MIPNYALIDALLKNQPRFPSGSTVTYSILDAAWFDYAAGYTTNPQQSTNRYGARNSFRPANAAQLAIIRKTLDAWEKVINIKFVYTDSYDNADIQFGFGDLSTMLNEVSGKRSDVAGYDARELRRKTGSTISNPSPIYQAIIINDGEDPCNDGTGKSRGSNVLGTVLLHEIGHALGLEHPSDKYLEGQPPSSGLLEDNMADTIMSYVHRKSYTTYEAQNLLEGYGSLLGNSAQVASCRLI